MFIFISAKSNSDTGDSPGPGELAFIAEPWLACLLLYMYWIWFLFQIVKFRRIVFSNVFFNVGLTTSTSTDWTVCFPFYKPILSWSENLVFWHPLVSRQRYSWSKARSFCWRVLQRGCKYSSLSVSYLIWYYMMWQLSPCVISLLVLPPRLNG